MVDVDWTEDEVIDKVATVELPDEVVDDDWVDNDESGEGDELNVDEETSGKDIDEDQVGDIGVESEDSFDDCGRVLTIIVRLIETGDVTVDIEVVKTGFVEEVKEL